MKRAPRLAILALILLLALALPGIATLLDQTYYVGFARRVLIFAIAATSLNFILGFGGMVSLGHAAFIGVGAYAIAIFAQHGVTAAIVAWPAAIVIAALAAAAIGALCLRTRGVYFIMITLAFAQMIYYLAVGLKRYGGEDGLSIAVRSTSPLLDLHSDALFYYLVLALLLLVLWIQRRVLAARFGRVLVGIRENEARMEAIGYPTTRFRLIAFTLAGAVAGLAGVLLANHNLFVSPSALHWTQSATLVAMVILGGIGHPLGGLVGAIVFLGLEELLAALTEYWHLPLGLLLLAAVFLAPRGLAALIDRRAP